MPGLAALFDLNCRLTRLRGPSGVILEGGAAWSSLPLSGKCCQQQQPVGQSLFTIRPLCGSFLKDFMAIYQLNDLTPTIDATAWVADNAQVIGNVTLGEDVSVWFGVVARGDTSRIVIGKGSNIQDNSVLHADHGMPLVIGENVTVGHQVMLHGCTVGDGSLIGIGAIVLNGAIIGRHCLVGAGALVTEGKEFPDGTMIIGSPAKAVRQLSPEQIEGLKMSAQHYVNNAARYKAGLKKIG